LRPQLQVKDGGAAAGIAPVRATGSAH